MSERHSVPSYSAWATYQRLLGFASRYWPLFMVGVIAIILGAGIDAGIAWLVKPLIDKGLIAKDSAVVTWMPLAVVIIFVLRGGVGFVAEYCVYRTGRNIIMTLRQHIFKHLLSLPTAFYNQQSSGELLALITYNVEQVASASTQALVSCLRDGLTVIGLLIVMFHLNWQLSAACLLSAPIVAWVVTFCSHRLRAISHRVQSAIGSVTHVAEQAIKGHRVVRLFGGAERENKRFRQETQFNRNQELKIVVTNSLSGSIVQILMSLPLALALYLVGILGNSISVGSFVAVAMAMGRLLRPLKALTRLNADLQKAVAAAQSIFKLLDAPAEVDEGEYAPRRVQGVVAFDNVSFAYPNVKKASLSQIDLRVEPGERVAFVGHSGAGKSTLLSLLPRFFDPSKGRICIDGKDIREFKLSSLRAQFSYVSQDTVLFNDTVLANIAYGQARPKKQDIIAAAKAAYAHKFIEELPKSYLSVIGENGVLLSGGQKQRLSIARALFKDAPILILDEATSSLDSHSEASIQKALQKLMKNRTTLIIAHRLSTIEQCDRIVVIDKGNIIEQGTHQTLLKQKGAYAELYKLQQLSEQKKNES